jgi:hypothetical protein
LDTDGNFTEESHANSVDQLLDNALLSAVHAWSIRWLPPRDAFNLVGEAVKEKAIQEDIKLQLWQRAREAMYPIKSRPNYCPSFAFQLFSSTPMPYKANDQR